MELCFLLALFLALAAATSDTPFWREYATPLDRLAERFPVTAPLSIRQDLLQCPGRQQLCAADELCCILDCCPKNAPLCWKRPTGTAEICMDSSGFGVCFNADDEKVFRRICRTGPDIICCGRTPGFDRCTVDAPFRCVNEDGYTPCGPDDLPGVSCGNGTCCINPRRCIPGSCVITGGTGGPRSLEPLPTGLTPANTPVLTSSTGPSAIPVPSEASESPAPAEASETPVSVTPSPSSAESSSLTPSDTAGASPSESFSSSSTPMPSGSTVPPATNPPLQPLFSPSQSSRVCFPAGATVELSNGRVVRMEQLRTGDHVRVGRGEFSEVFMWTHRDTKHRGDEYVRLAVAGGYVFTAARGHMVYVCRSGHGECEKEVVRVENVRVGEMVWIVEGDSERVAEVTKSVGVRARGLFNPQTLHGDIVVNGVLSTCYTRAIHFRTAHGALAPLRALYAIFAYVILSK